MHRLLLVGDVNQLPPVGPGRPFADMIELADAGHGHVSRLERVHRAAAESWVCRTAPGVLRGQAIDLGEQCDDFRAHVCELAEDVARTAVDLIERGEVDVVLVPQRRGECGVVAINQQAQARLNPHGQPIQGAQSSAEAGPAPRVGDPVMQTANNYDLRVMNGECGRVVRTFDGGAAVDFGDGRTVTYGSAQVGALTLAYAVTIHKSQGSEWPNVGVVCHSSHSFQLSRGLLYTAITRASRTVRIIGDEAGVQRSARNNQDAKRNSGLVMMAWKNG